MAIQTLYDTGASYQVTSKMDGAVYDLAVGGDAVCGGIGDEFTPTYSANSLDMTFSSGSEAVIGGAYFKVTSNTTIILPANSTVYLCARINNSAQAGSTGSFQSLTQAQITQGNLNGGASTRDLLLYIVRTSASGITSVQDRRVIKTNSSSSYGGYTVWVGTQAQYDAITTKDNTTLYFIKEQ